MWLNCLLLQFPFGVKERMAGLTPRYRETSWLDLSTGSQQLERCSGRGRCHTGGQGASVGLPGGTVGCREAPVSPDMEQLPLRSHPHCHRGSFTFTLYLRERFHQQNPFLR